MSAPTNERVTRFVAYFAGHYGTDLTEACTVWIKHDDGSWHGDGFSATSPGGHPSRSQALRALLLRLHAVAAERDKAIARALAQEVAQ